MIRTSALLLVAGFSLPLLAGWKQPIPRFPAVVKADDLREEPMPAHWGPQLPEAPLAGAMLTTYLGRFVVYPTRFDVQGRLRWRAQRVEGPAGMGPYEHGLSLEMVSEPGDTQGMARITAIRDELGIDRGHSWGVGDFIEDPAKFHYPAVFHDLTLGLFLFQYRMSNLPGSMFPVYRPNKLFEKRGTGGVQSVARAGTPAQLPATFNPDGPIPVEAGAWFKQASARLLVLRAAHPAYQPLVVDWAGRKWVVVGPSRSGRSLQLEFWADAPGPDARGSRPEATCDLPGASSAIGAVLSPGGQAARIRDAVWDPGTGRLTRLELEPWKPDALPFLLTGKSEANTQEGLALAFNDALVDWKVKALTSYVRGIDEAAAADFLARLEKTLLRMDMDIRRRRQARESQEQDALSRQAADGVQRLQQEASRRRFLLPAELREMGEDDGRTTTSASPELMDLLDQRKAIVSAILANAKQLLAAARR
ncbi:hypothetical protein [Geothrix edaphica]|uniref:Uncharacterized protein n=1 Tax=Geothrix edaphica TaxID=2927976 RepID=A0ABQ5Q0A0_9BACT|nr:hypothetical protein [Geothrix edaphica]GLH68056.1 hypothetical protein GETHED_24200 [Geothrix edaphica]